MTFECYESEVGPVPILPQAVHDEIAAVVEKAIGEYKTRLFDYYPHHEAFGVLVRVLRDTTWTVLPIDWHTRFNLSDWDASFTGRFVWGSNEDAIGTFHAFETYKSRMCAAVAEIASDHFGIYITGMDNAPRAWDENDFFVRVEQLVRVHAHGHAYETTESLAAAV